MDQQLLPYVKIWKKYLEERWKISDTWSEKAAALVIYCSLYRLNPQITSGYRTKEEQARLVGAANAGNPYVHTPLPPGKSLHNACTWYGKPASLAMDMVTNNAYSAGSIAKYLGLVWGGPRDHVHFAERRGTL